jgi:hypothetical protein
MAVKGLIYLKLESKRFLRAWSDIEVEALNTRSQKSMMGNLILSFVKIMIIIIKMMIIYPIFKQQTYLYQLKGINLLKFKILQTRGVDK